MRMEDDAITLAQARSEKVFDIGQETRSAHRPVEHTRRGDLIVPKRGSERWKPRFMPPRLSRHSKTYALRSEVVYGCPARGRNTRLKRVGLDSLLIISPHNG
jgi:hypothetical protein